MSERAFERKLEAMVAARRNPQRSPHTDRILYSSDQESDAIVATDEAELRRRLNPEARDCNCYPSLLHMSAEDKAELKRAHLDAGVHRMACPMWVDPSPLFSRRGDAMPRSYGSMQRRRDESWQPED